MGVMLGWLYVEGNCLGFSVLHCLVYTQYRLLYVHRTSITSDLFMLNRYKYCTLSSWLHTFTFISAF
jgi:hypothetical protein